MQTEAEFQRFIFKGKFVDISLWTYFFGFIFFSIMEETWLKAPLYIFSVVAGSIVLSFALNKLLRKSGFETLGKKIFSLNQPQDQSSGFRSNFWFYEISLFLLLTLIASIVITRFSILDLLDYDGFWGVYRLLGGLLSPNWSILSRALQNIVITIYMAFLATFLATPIAFIICFFASKNIMTHPAAFVVYLLLRGFFNFTRSIEAVIWAIIFSVWVGIGPFAGMLALFVHSVASLAKQYSEIVETISYGPVEAIKSTGANLVQVIWFAIVPQVFLPFVSFTIYRWDINIRMATIVGLVGGGGIGTMLIQYQGQAMWNEVGTIVIVIALVVWIMDVLSAYIREALR